jgi:methyl-accepting chemotaxis protein
MLKRFQDLKVATKLLIIVVAMAIPIVFATWLFVRETNIPLAATQNELRGMTYVDPLGELFNDINMHRARSAAALFGVAGQEALLEPIAAEVNADFAVIEKLTAEQGDPYGLAPMLGDLKNKFQAVRQRGLEGVTPEESLARHMEMALAVNEIRTTTAERSELLLDPVLETFHLMSIAVIELAEIRFNVGLLRYHDVKHHAKGVSLLEHGEARAEIELLRREMDALRRDVKVIKEVDSPLGTALEAPLEAAIGGFERYVARFEEYANTAAAAAEARQRVGQNDVLPAVEQTAVSAASVDRLIQEGLGALSGFITFQEQVETALESELTDRAAAIREEQMLEIGIGLVGLLLSIGLSWWVTRSITTPVKGMMALFSAIGMGDFKARVAANSTDELGMLGKSLNAMLDNIMGLMQSRDERDQMQQSIQKLLEEVSGVADGDLTAEAEVTADMTGAIADSFNQMITELRKVIGQVQGATVRVSTSAQQLQATTNALAEGSERQAMQIIDTSAAVEEMAASIGQVSENAASSAAVAEQSRANADQGAKAVSRTIEGMSSIRDQVQETAKRIKRLGESSQEVGEIVQLIGDIADRTSILALNASIQAAMAGEAGRGFAVVAEEVERLADRATDATKRISTLIKTTQSETAEAVAAMEDTTREVVKGSELANEAGVALTEIKTVSDRLAQLIQAISDASHQQSKGSEQVAKAMGEISENTRKTATATKDTAVSIGSLAVLSGELNSSMARFKLPSTAGNRRDKAA